MNQAVFRMKDGRLIRQVGGIPMGDALSPAMTIGTCGWMEREWMTSLHENAKSKFAAKRYMDDILLFFLKDGWDSEKFYAIAFSAFSSQSLAISSTFLSVATIVLCLWLLGT